MSFLKFLLQYLRRPRSIGAIIPSSPALVEAMLKPVSWANVKLIVEFGPGTGVMTKAILARMRADATLVAYEINPTFFKQLSTIKDSRFVLKKESAAHMTEHPDVIISSLPLLSLPHETRKAILKNAGARLHQDGVYMQYQYVSTLETLIIRFFPKIKRTWVAVNVPPAFVYECHSK